MAFYLNSVLQKYLKQQDREALAKSRKKYTNYFHDPKIQENILSSKDEEDQGVFLTEMFAKILGYTMKPNANYNLVAETKNPKSSKNAGGAILKDNKAIAVIEFKGAHTKALEKASQQAFAYKASQAACAYVITTNFQKIRFYLNNADDFEEFDLFTLSQERFELLYLCLAPDNLLGNVPLQLQEASVQEEEAIAKKFHKDYAAFKRELFRDLVKHNMTNEVFRTELNMEDAERANKNIKHHLFKKSQKLIDRFLFLFFAEDRGLLAPNSSANIVAQWHALKEMDEEVLLYSLYKKYFNYLDTGRKGSDKTTEIFAYNGGLFKPDATLDNLIISDELLFKHTPCLHAYDLESQVDVNILGHIFENSLNETESIKAEIEGGDVDKQKTKRKKDGVFYTPKYITQYIVDTTVGKLCSEKKTELGIREEAYFKRRKGRPVKTLAALRSHLAAYREWLLHLTILDPACGSGAFLNQALDHLIKEHQYIDELQTNLLGGGLVFPDIENTVLENNIFGVDINEESVEIAKLSLWLRTAQPGRKLNDLSRNIKCGNSLIESKAFAGDKAFKWEEEFSQIVAKGGFDVVIGNPPYVRQEFFKAQKPYLEENFKSFQGTADLYVYFLEKSVDHLLSPKGIYSSIVANKWMKSNYGKPLRKWMKTKEIVEIIDFGDLPVFTNASTYPCIVTLRPNLAKDSFSATLPENLGFSDLKLLVKNQGFSIKTKSLEENGWSLVASPVHELLATLKRKGKPLKDLVNSKIFYGIKTGMNQAFLIDNDFKEKILKENPDSASLLKPFVAGKDIKRYSVDFQGTYLLLIPHGWTDKNRAKSDAWSYLQDKHPLIANHLFQYMDPLIKRSDQGKYWWELRACVYYQEFEKPKLLLSDISSRGNFVLDNGSNYYTVNTASVIGDADEFLLGVLNSKLITFYYKNISPAVKGGYLRFTYQYLINIPIVDFEAPQKSALFASFVAEIQDNKRSMQTVVKNFLTELSLRQHIEYCSKKLQSWHELAVEEFLQELNKAIKKIGGEKLSQQDEMEWMENFETKKAEAQALKNQLDKTDAQIDAMVYELYGLSAEEIKIVEES
jgi:type I restriction-modification system DNA methylase subunit